MNYKKIFSDLVEDVDDFFYRLRCHITPHFGRFNCVKIRTLGPTWTDRSEVLPHMIMTIAEDYITKELQGGPKRCTQSDQEIADIVHWWKTVYLVHRPIMRLPHMSQHDWGKLLSEYENKKEKELTRKCMRLVELRGRMWV